MLGLLLALPAATAGAASGAPTLKLEGPKRPGVLSKVTAVGTLPNAASGEQVTVEVEASGREILTKKVTPKGDGSFQVPFAITACCNWSVTATHGNQSSGAQRFSSTVPRHLRKGAVTKFFNDSLQGMGFHTGATSSRLTIGSHLAIKAFRKTNGMGRSDGYTPRIFRLLLMGRGAFKPEFHDGRHMEVDISRQVMALVEGDKATHVFHVSTGAGGTPTVRGNFRFYMKQPGYNAKRMYYSVYFIGGYATHGYNPVPNYPASHGCVRNPIPFSRFIYNWIQIGDPAHVYG